MNIRRKYIFNYIFISGIILLFLNDHIFKWEFSNWITGKLSDFIGLLIFPFFLTFLFPKVIKWNVIITGLFFVFWKSPYSQGFIDIYNPITFIKITRIIDYSDYIALSVLPISYYLLNNIKVLKQFYFSGTRIHPIIVLLPSIVVFMATSPPIWHSFHLSEGNIHFHKNSININKSQMEILSEIKSMNISVRRDTAMYTNNRDRLDFFVVDELVLDKDTIKDLRFSLISFKENKTKVFLNAITVSNNIEADEVKNELKKYYKKVLKKYFKRNLK